MRTVAARRSSSTASEMVATAMRPLRRGLRARDGGLHLEGVEDGEHRGRVLRDAAVAHLAAGFGVEGRAVEDDDAVGTRFNRVDGLPVDVEGEDFGVFFGEGVVPREDRLGARRTLRPAAILNMAFARAAARWRSIARSNPSVSTARPRSRQTSAVRSAGEAVGVVKLEEDFAVQNAVRRFGHGGFEDFHALRNRLEEAAFFV